MVPHQANRRILDGTARKLNLPAERVVITIDRHANTSAASVPLALSEAVGDGRIGPGMLVLMEAMGGGFTWGAALARFEALVSPTSVTRAYIPLILTGFRWQGSLRGSIN